MRLAALFALPALLSADVLTVTLKPIPAKHTRKIIGRGQAGIWTVMACSDSPKTLTVPRERIMGEALQIPDLPNAMAQDIVMRQIADSPFSFIGGQGDAILGLAASGLTAAGIAAKSSTAGYVGVGMAATQLIFRMLAAKAPNAGPYLANLLPDKVTLGAGDCHTWYVFSALVARPTAVQIHIPVVQQ